LATFKPKNQIDMSDINFIIAQKEDLRSLIYQWLDEHPHFLFRAGEKEKESDKPKPMSKFNHRKDSIIKVNNSKK
jgi:hypothetical protein